MHNLIIEPRACPRCGIRRTARLYRRAISHCFNCRWQWEWSAFAESQLAAPPRADYSFSTQEVARLKAYRGAIRRGLYSDW
jgi:hypothetical protein